MEYMDFFLIDINLSNDKLMSAAFYISEFSKKVKGSIHIIDFCNTIRNYFTINEEKNKEFIENTKNIIPKLIFPEVKKDIQWIIDYISTLSKNDMLLINGAERLVAGEDAKKAFETDFGKTQYSMYLLSDLNWKPFIKNLDDIYLQYQEKIKGIVSLIYTDSICKEIILDLLKDSENMSIISSWNPNTDNGNDYLHKELMNVITSSSLEESRIKIEEKRAVLGEINCDLMLANAYYKNGNIHKSVELLEKHIDILNNNQKLHLANMYRIIGVVSKAEEILIQLEQTDCYLNNLYESILNLYDVNNAKYSYWIEKAKEKNPNNIHILERYAQFLSIKCKNLEAAEEYRKLECKTNTGYYEVLARVNEVIARKTKSIKDIHEYIFSISAINNSIKNEAVLLLALHFEENYRSDYLCYNILRKGILEYDCEYAQEIVIKKIEILEDLKRASRALGKLKPHKKEKHAVKIANARSRLVIEAIQILAGNKKGYLYWRNLLETEQENLWLKQAYFYLKSKLDFFNNNIDSKLNASYLYDTEKYDLNMLTDDLIQNPEQANVKMIRLLRRIKMNEYDYLQDFGSNESFIQTVMTIAEINNNWAMRVLLRYNLSIIFTNRGEHQLANNSALSIFEYCDKEDKSLKILAMYLGLLSWGYSQYRIGRKHEGILCVLSSMKYCVLSDEILPFVEEGVNIIGRFLVDCECIRNDVVAEKDLWLGLSETLKHLNPSMNNLLICMFNQTEEYKKQLIKSVENEVGDWTGDFVNLVSIYLKIGDEKRAIKLIVDKGKRVADLLKNRKDIRYAVLYNWSWLLLGNITDDIIEYGTLALFYIELAYKDIEEKRRVAHREERGTIGDESKRIQKLYLDICCCMILLNEYIYISDYLNNKIDDILLKLAPRSVVEQKIQYSITTDKAEYIADEKEYEVLVDEYTTMQKNNVDIGEQSKKAKEILEIQNKLKHTHPHYMELKEYRQVSISEIQKSLHDKEILYINVLTKIGVYELIISHNDLHRDYRVIDINKANISNLTHEFGMIMQKGEKSTHSDEINSVIADISQQLCFLLLNYVDDHYLNRAYYMLDYEVGMFPLVCVKNEKFSLMDRVESLIRIIDYSIIFNSKSQVKIDGVLNRSFGNNDDAEIKLISEHISKSITEKTICAKNESDDFSNILQMLQSNQFINTVIIFGHGSSNPIASKTKGAYGIEGKDQIIHLDNIIKSLKIDNLIIISCSAGTITGDSVEKSTGALISVLERFSGNFIICKWDVNTKTTLEFVDIMVDKSLNYGLTIDRAFLQAQKEIRNKFSGKPFYWAGLELWKN